MVGMVRRSARFTPLTFRGLIMKVQLLDQRAWRRNSYITNTGLVLNEHHLITVAPAAWGKAAFLTTVLIDRIMKS